MRTTITIDGDLYTLLKDAAHRSGRSFTQVLNDALRAGLMGAAGQAPPYKQRVFSLGLPKVDLSKAGALAADLDDWDAVAAGKRLRRPLGGTRHQAHR